MLGDDDPQEMYNRLKKLVSKVRAYGSRRWGDRRVTDRILRGNAIVGDHKMHIFTANIPTFHSRYRSRCLLLTNSMSFVDLPFQEHRMKEKHYMDQNPCISSLCPK
jgi:hypothetical protein